MWICKGTVTTWEEQHQEEEAEMEEAEDDKEDGDEDDGKEPWTIGLGEMVHTSSNDDDSMVQDRPIVLPEDAQ